MNTKHTPGPWHVDRDAFKQSARLRGGDNMRLILRWDAFARRGSAETEANARLIAAAPDLLEALKAIVGKGIAGIPERFDDLTTMQMDVLVKAIWDGRAAIAKATDTTNL